MEAAGAPVTDQILVFSVGGSMHALYLANVEKAELSAELIPLPEAPSTVIGAVNWKGWVLPVLSMRRRLHLPDRAISTGDRFIITRYSRRRIVLVVDESVGVQTVERGDITKSGDIADGLGAVAGAARVPDGIVLIQDPELFLSEEDENVLEES